MMTETSASAACSVLASVSSACLKARDWAANGSGPTYRVLPSALSVSTAWGKGMTYPCGGNDNSGLRSSPLAYSGHISGGSDRSGVCEVPMPSTIFAIPSAYPSDPRICVHMGEIVRPGARAAPWPSVRALLVALRPRQWTKNGLVFIALAFTLNLQETSLLLRTLVAFLCFCALSSAGYLLNDVVDVEADRAHPTKRRRPIAAGKVPVGFALGLGVVLALLGTAIAFRINVLLGVLALAYALLTAVYSTTLKHI